MRFGAGRSLLITLALGVASLCLPVHVLAATDKPLILAVHPYLPTPEIQERFKPLADYLATTLGRAVSVRVGGSYQEHIDAIGKDTVDIAFMGPAPYVHLVQRYGAKPLLARFEVNHQPQLFGVIAVHRNTAISSLSEFDGRRFAFGDPESTMSHFVPRYMLMQAGIAKGAPIQHRFLGSHKNVALGILAGDFDGGAMKKEIFDEYESKGLKAVAITPGVPDHLFVARTNLPDTEIERIRKAMLQLRHDTAHKSVLDKLHKDLTALLPVTDRDYDALRKMVQAVDAVSR